MSPGGPEQLLSPPLPLSYKPEGQGSEKEWLGVSTKICLNRVHRLLVVVI